MERHINYYMQNVFFILIFFLNAKKQTISDLNICLYSIEFRETEKTLYFKGIKLIENNFFFFFKAVVFYVLVRKDLHFEFKGSSLCDSGAMVFFIYE